jgi:hypothetical protein
VFGVSLLQSEKFRRKIAGVFGKGRAVQ